ncbi:4Fe-4S dicluster domain-containing protein [Geomesophilobacter sediminis]|uniref:4Fe-4S dicluster domain-containing protein n=1 Tax=Geomesophilobacter sediminis TaxID=2798584 RepID=A0A8J7LWQ2_9BACT|nr:4Fe-4S dicluster domain-containing protein [Geomesophilobacter sediminis]MBJ6726100.1 4Fe-4S dicluster domain-containing protein [Geomesophilobacter sediminis]
MSPISRRTFLWLTGGTGVAIATAAERKVVNRLIPQVIPPEQIQPGEWSFFATTCRECPAGCGLQLWHRDGRVTKAEGNPQHPINRGTLCPRGQSAVQGLYDPDRLQTLTYRPKGGPEQKGTWEQALGFLGKQLAGGGRAAVLSGLQTGALAEVMRGFAQAFGGRLLWYERFNYEPLKRAHRELFGLPVIPSYDLSGCDFIISFGADFLESWISPVEYAGQFAQMHALRSQAPLGRPRMGRFVYVGPRLSMTAANADEFIQVPPDAVRLVAAAILKASIGHGKQDLSSVAPALNAYLGRGAAVPGVPPEKIAELAQAFTSASASVALAGPVGSMSLDAAEAAGAAALLNYGAGRIGQTVNFARPHALSNAATDEELRAVLTTLGPNDILFVHECNPLYSRPELAPLMKRAGTIVYLGTMMDETAQAAQWVLPTDYPLESWGEYAPYPGVNGIMQPTMGRLYDTMGAGDLFLELARRGGRTLTRSGGGSPADFQGWLQANWQAMRPAAAPQAPEAFWTSALRSGGIWGTEGAGKGVTLAAKAAEIFGAGAPPHPADAATAQLWLWGSVLHFDGRLANRGWIQEAPDPLTSIMWGNWVDLHPGKAKALGIADGDVAELETPSGKVQLPVRVTEEVSEETAAVAFGFGHQALGRIAKGVGASSYLLPGAPATGGAFGTCRIRKAAGCESPAYTMLDREQHHRDIVQWAPLSEVSRMAPGEGDQLILPLPEGYRKEKDLYPKREYKAHRWAMVIDLQRCIGCGACSVACYAENNIAVIGGPRISHGREMSWIRVAPYRKPGSKMGYGFLPLPCQHCDAAPCEPVCPVFAAMHNEEGLNAQIYNRCIGTRYCSNNCPYKVRRFNWVNIRWERPLDLQLNPEVTVRSRGVMEKCTFCVQRIRQVEFQAAVERRKIRDGEIQPACAQTCPTRVFTFGDLLDPDSQVSKLTRTDPRRYHVLEDLNTKPAVTYLRKVDIDK